MKKVLSLFLLLCFSLQSYSQNYEDMNASEFLNSNIPDVEFNLFEPDYQLLYVTLFHTINYKRLKKGYAALKFSDELFKAADSLTRINRTARFVFNEQNVNRMNKSIKPACKKFGFKGNLLGFAISAPYALNYRPGREFYLNRKDTAQHSYKLYYGNIRDRNNPKVKKKPIPPYTYRQFAEALLRQWLRGSNGRAVMNKAYTYFACSVVIDQTTLNRMKIPVARSIAVLGGSYLSF